jgi:ABC-type polysaccharide/polyol phosphate export permease
LALGLSSFGLGLIAMVVGFLNPSAHQFLPILVRPLWIISAAFYSTAAFPQWLRPLVCWNPIVQAIELNRRAFSIDYPLPEEISLPYLLLFSALACIVGLWAYYENERALLTR